MSNLANLKSFINKLHDKGEKEATSYVSSNLTSKLRFYSLILVVLVIPVTVFYAVNGVDYVKSFASEITDAADYSGITDILGTRGEVTKINDNEYKDLDLSKLDVRPGEIIVKLKKGNTVKKQYLWGMLTPDLQANDIVPYDKLSQKSIPDSIKELSQKQKIKQIRKMGVEEVLNIENRLNDVRSEGGVNMLGLKIGSKEKDYGKNNEQVQKYIKQQQNIIDRSRSQKAKEKILEGVYKIELSLSIEEVKKRIDKANSSTKIQETLKNTADIVNNDKKVSTSSELQTKTIEDTLEATVSKALLEDKDIEYAVPNVNMRVANVPNDNKYEDLWGMKKIKASEAWDVSTGSNTVIVADIDTGVDYTHEDLIKNIWINWAELKNYTNRLVDTNNNSVIDCQDLFDSRNSFINDGVDSDGNGYIDDYCGWDFYNNDNNPMDDMGHGTHVAGTIGAEGNNKIGVVGINWTVSIIPIKFLDSGGAGSLLDGMKGLMYASDMGASITSNSWGAGGYYQPMCDAIDYAYQKNVLSVAAAGNSYGLASNFTPANCKNSFVVGATDIDDNRTAFSNGGDKLDVTAPGASIWSSLPGNNYAAWSGTSMATPHVSGLAALILSKNSLVNVEQLKIIIKIPSDDLGFPGKDGDFGYGRISAKKSLEFVNQYPDPIAPYISYPSESSSISGTSLDIMGNLAGSGFSQYTLVYSIDEKNWINITTSNNQIINGTIGSIDLTKFKEDDVFTIKLIVKDTSSNTYEYVVKKVVLNNFEISINNKGILFSGYNDILGTVKTTNDSYFKEFKLEYREKGSSDKWTTENLTLMENGKKQFSNEKIAYWDAAGLKVGTAYTLKLTINTDVGLYSECTRDLVIDSGMMKGWPVNIADSNYRFQGITTEVIMPAISDIDNDGKKDIVVASGNRIYAFDIDGKIKEGFPYEHSLGRTGCDMNFTCPMVFYDPVVISDINNDGYKEIIATAKDDFMAQTVAIVVLDHKGKDLKGWPVTYGTLGHLCDFFTPSVADIDEDNRKEIMFLTCNLWSKPGEMTIHSLDVNGKEINGYGKSFERECINMGAISIYDINNDEHLEFGIVNGSDSINWGCWGSFHIYLFDKSSNILPGWPLVFSDATKTEALMPQTLFGKFTSKDKINLGYAEARYVSPNTTLRYVDSDGNLKGSKEIRHATDVGWGPMQYKFAAGDMDNNGIDEVAYGLSPSIALSDVDGDSQLETVKIDENDKKLKAYRNNGEVYWETAPLTYFDKLNPPSVADINNDGNMEAVIILDYQVYVWSIPTVNGKKASKEWSMFLHDPQHTANISTPIEGVKQPDLIPPTVNIKNLVLNQEVWGKYVLKVDVKDDKSLSTVKAIINGTDEYLMNYVINDEFEKEVDFSKYVKGSGVVVKVIATDTSRNNGDSSVTVKIEPEKIFDVNIISPTNDSEVSSEGFYVGVRANCTPASSDTSSVLDSIQNSINAVLNRLNIGADYTSCSGIITQVLVSVCKDNSCSISEQLAEYSKDANKWTIFVSKDKLFSYIDQNVTIKAIAIDSVNNSSNQISVVTKVVEPKVKSVEIINPANDSIFYVDSSYYKMASFTVRINVPVVNTYFGGSGGTDVLCGYGGLKCEYNSPSESIFDANVWRDGVQSFTLSASGKDGIQYTDTVNVNVKWKDQNPGGDMISPVATIKVPTNNEEVEGKYVLKADSTDDKEISSVKAIVNGADEYTLDYVTNNEYEKEVDFGKYTKESNIEVKVIATDTSGNKGENSVTVKIKGETTPPEENKFDITITAPTNGNEVSSEGFNATGKADCVLSSSNSQGILDSLTSGVNSVLNTLNLGVASATCNGSVKEVLVSVCKDINCSVDNQLAEYVPTTKVWLTNIPKEKLVSFIGQSITIKTKAKDTSNNISEEAIIIVNVKDTEKPYVKITDPYSGQILDTKPYLVKINATDNTGIKEVKLQVGLEEYSLTNSPYEKEIDFSKYQNGSTQTLIATATDVNNNTSVDAIEVKINSSEQPPEQDTTPPSITIKDPTNNQEIDGNYVVKVDATDNSAVSSVKAIVNGSDEYILNHSLNNEYESEVDFSKYQKGSSVVIKATATDTSNNTKEQSVVVKIKQEEQPPEPSECPNGVNDASVLLSKPNNGDTYKVNENVSVEVVLTCRLNKMALVTVMSNKGNNIPMDYDNTSGKTTTYKRTWQFATEGEYEVYPYAIITDIEGQSIQGAVQPFGILKDIKGDNVKFNVIKDQTPPEPSECSNGVNDAKVTVIKPDNGSIYSSNQSIEYEITLTCRMGKVAIPYVTVDKGYNFSLDYITTEGNKTIYKRTWQFSEVGEYNMTPSFLITDVDGNTLQDIKGSYQLLKKVNGASINIKIQ